MKFSKFHMRKNKNKQQYQKTWDSSNKELEKTLTSLETHTQDFNLVHSNKQGTKSK